MLSKFVAAAVLGSALIAAPAMAQNNKMNEPKSNTAAMNETASKAGLWQGSKLIGLNVYNDQNEKIGSIKELMLDKSGNIASAVIGVGGFLGMGQHDIMVEMSKLKFIDEPARTSSTTTTTTGSATTSTTNRPATTTTTSTTKNKWYPDHAVLSGATKESLKNIPEFKYE